MSCLYILMVRCTLLFVFLASVTFFSLGESLAAIGGASVVTPSTPGFNPAGPASNNAYGVYESLSKSVGTGRVGYPSVPVANRASMSAGAARTAMSGVWRAVGWVGAGVVIVSLGGEFLNWLQCSTNQICVPQVDLPPGYTGPVAPVNVLWYQPGVGFVRDKRSACMSTYPYSQWGISYAEISPVGECGYGSGQSVGGISTQQTEPYCTGTLVLAGGMCVAPTGVPRVVTDAELGNAASSYMQQNPAAFISDLKSRNAWNPDRYEMSAPQPDVAGAPIIRELPETKAGAPAGNKIEEITPHTAAKVSPDGQSVTVYNYNTTVTTHTDNTTETAVDSQSPDLDIPDDYAREETLDAIRDALIEREASPGSDDCQSAPVCSGDAIACAVLVEQYKGRCAVRQESIPDESPLPPTETDLNLLVGNLNQSRWSGSAVCPPDITATVAGHTVRIPMDSPCDQAAFIRPVVISLGLLWAAMIIMRVE